MHAAEAADTSSGAYKAFVETIATDLPSAGLNGVTNTLVDGGGFEDNIDVEGDGGGKRSMNHFYDPLTHLGLSNIPPDDRIAPLGRNSFAWASTRNCPGVDFRGLLGLGANLATFNKWSWQNARDYEWDGLTLPDSTSRHDALTNMFRAVGQVMHLLEDTTQPQHARNEQHLDQFWKGRDTPWRSAIEDYGKARLDSLSFTHAMLDWKVAGFSKLEDFWDRRLYNGSATVLRDAENAAGPVLGLAEWSNGNFLGARHLFPEYSTIGKVDYYPFPSRTTSTDYNGVKSDPLLGIDDLDPEDGQGKGIYLRKNSDGVEMRHLARVNYLGAKVPGLSGKPYCTTRDANVLRDYHAALIPKAVAYSAAVIDYYFRGRIQANASPGSSANRVALMIQNVSGEKMHGGSFQLFYDGPGGRSPLPFAAIDYDPPTGLDDQDTVTAEFARPEGPIDAYVLVFRGDIGMNGVSASDPVDAGIAIAVAGLNIPRITTESLPATVCGTAYSETIEAEGGVPPYTFAVTAGSLPNGLALASDGTLSGTVSGAACDGVDKEFTVRVADSSGNATAHVLTVAVGGGICPDWSALSWGPAYTVSQNDGTATFSPNNAQGSTFDTAATSSLDGGGPTTSYNIGRIIYNGPGCQANLHIDCSATGASQYLSGTVTVYSLTSYAFFNFEERGVGSFNIAFSLPDTHGNPMEISVMPSTQTRLDAPSGSFSIHISGQITTQ